MEKKGIIIAVVTLLIAGCAVVYSMTPRQKAPIEVLAAHEPEEENTAYLDDYIVKFVSSTHRQEEVLGEQVDVIYIDCIFTNNNDDSVCFSYAVDNEAFQNGIGLEDFNFHDFTIEDSNRLVEIKPGKSLNITLAYKLHDNSTPVDVEVSKLFSDDVYTMTYDLC